jgi:hypothetical protein
VPVFICARALLKSPRALPAQNKCPPAAQTRTPTGGQACGTLRRGSLHSYVKQSNFAWKNPISIISIVLLNLVLREYVLSRGPRACASASFIEKTLTDTTQRASAGQGKTTTRLHEAADERGKQVHALNYIYCSRSPCIRPLSSSNDAGTLLSVFDMPRQSQVYGTHPVPVYQVHCNDV